jgi:hypothetical protein
MKKFHERRSGRDRRDWDMFVHPNRRASQERRSGKDRRQSAAHYLGEERRHVVAMTETPPPRPIPTIHAHEKTQDKTYYSTAEVAELTGLSQTTLLLWIRNKMIDGSRIKRSVEGKRLWTLEDIEEIRRVKTRNGWTG